MRIGKLQQRWSEDRPLTYDKETRTVNLFITEELRQQQSNESEGEETEAKEVAGYSYYPVQIDCTMDYGHIKSQLIEAAYAQKDEFGLVMNAVDGILNALSKSTIKEIQSALLETDVVDFKAFCKYRAVCAEAAKAVMEEYE